MPHSRYTLFLLCLLLVFGNAVSAYAQAINFCEISYLRFDYPETVPAHQAFTVTTTVALFSCDVGPVVARVDLSDFHHNLISSSYSWVNSPVTYVTNTITAPQIGDPNIIYATAYMVLFSGQIVGHYMSWFQLSVVPPTEVTTTNSSAVQINSQTVASPTTVTSTSTFASTGSAPALFATTISSENVSALILSSDLPYELVIVVAILFMVTLAVLYRRKKQ
jgi:hypothetical protein